MPAEPIRPTMATVHMDRLIHNMRAVRSLLDPAVGILAAVKGDAYGHGARQVARALESAGCDWFGVALVEEGIRLRDAGIRSPILCLGGVGPVGASAAIEHRLTPVLYDLADAERLERAAASRHEPCGVHLKVDTGMGRLGVPLPVWENFLDRLAGFRWLRVDGICSHLSWAEHEETVITDEQGRRFVEAVQVARARGLRPAMLHIANSAGLLAQRRLHFDLVRPGLLLYGVRPSMARAEQISVEPIMEVRTQVLFAKDVPVGVGLSYGRTWTSTRTSRIATLPVGYADGYPRALSNKAEVLIHGHRAPVRGRVCMDLTMVDVTDIPTPVVAGDEVVLLGGRGTETITVEELAQHAGTIPYEILCGFSERLPRQHRASSDIDKTASSTA